MEDKLKRLTEYFIEKKSVIIAFSGGVDSTFMLKVAHDALGDRCVAVTVLSALFSQSERSESVEFCEKEGITHKVLQVDALGIEGFCENPKNRCYICKKNIFSQIQKLGAELGIENVCEGSNVTDEGDYRPGLVAIAELGVLSPLRACGYTKDEIRRDSAALGLSTASKPSFACLATRFPTGETITAEGLKKIELGEELLKELGFTQYRVRIHGDVARLELYEQEFPRIMEEGVRRAVDKRFKEIGFRYVALDLGGYKMGNMNII